MTVPRSSRSSRPPLSRSHSSSLSPRLRNSPIASWSRPLSPPLRPKSTKRPPIPSSRESPPLSLRMGSSNLGSCAPPCTTFRAPAAPLSSTRGGLTWTWSPTSAQRAARWPPWALSFRLTMNKRKSSSSLPYLLPSIFCTSSSRRAPCHTRPSSRLTPRRPPRSSWPSRASRRASSGSSAPAGRAFGEASSLGTATSSSSMKIGPAGKRFN
mmetsp:Transcript_106/g.234  ORF Transcript_106/g.234 Transcript_106/m.234 type:complete len:211 (+) Transcript_106:70-702(+)